EKVQIVIDQDGWDPVARGFFSGWTLWPCQYAIVDTQLIEQRHEDQRPLQRRAVAALSDELRRIGVAVRTAVCTLQADLPNHPGEGLFCALKRRQVSQM